MAAYAVPVATPPISDKQAQPYSRHCHTVLVKPVLLAVCMHYHMIPHGYLNICNNNSVVVLCDSDVNAVRQKQQRM